MVHSIRILSRCLDEDYICTYNFLRPSLSWFRRAIDLVSHTSGTVLTGTHFWDTFRVYSSGRILVTWWVILMNLAHDGNFICTCSFWLKKPRIKLVSEAIFFHTKDLFFRRKFVIASLVWMSLGQKIYWRRYRVATSVRLLTDSLKLLELKRTYF